MSERGPGGGGESEFERKKREINHRLLALIKPGAPLREIARMLGAEDLLQAVKGSRGSGLRFDVNAFVEREARKSHALLLPDEFIKLSTTVVPPDEGETIVTGGGGGIEAKNIIPRSRYLAEVLTELNQRYLVVSGTNTKNMVRQESYQAFVIPGLERIVLVNDEEGNATFVIKSDKQGEYEVLMEMTKDELRDLGEEKVQSVKYSGDANAWKAKLNDLLTNKFEESERSTGNPFVQTERVGEGVEFAPPGWITIGAAATQFDTTDHRIARMIEAPLKEHPEWLRRFRSVRGHIHDYYDPALAEWLRTEFNNAPPEAPPGWLHARALSLHLGISQGKALKMITAILKEHPDWSKRYKDKQGKELEFYDPALVERLRLDIAKEPISAPPGWRTNLQLAKELNLGNHTTQRIIDALSADHPGWLVEYKNEDNIIRTYASPELAALVREEAKARELPPEGWKGFKSIASEAGVSKEVVADLVAKNYAAFRGRPEFFRTFRSANGVHAEFLHPDFVKLIIEDLRRETAPEGWMNLWAFSHELKEEAERTGSKIVSSPRQVQKELEKHRSEHPDWFKIYKTMSRGAIREHFHPDLLKRVKESLAR